MKHKAIQLQTNIMIYDTGQHTTLFQIIRCFGFSRYIVSAMHLDIHYV